MKIAVYSGSFDPIHTGHAMIANYLSQYCDLDSVWLMPSPLNPLKKDSTPAPDNKRLQMCQIVARKCRNVEVSDFEFNLPKPSFTYRTLCELRDAFPQHTFSLVIGSDNWLCFDKWRDYDKIISEFQILIYPRPGYEISGTLPAGVILLDNAPQALISSTFIRNGIAEGKNMNFFIDPEVSDYIKINELYDRKCN
ncbi:MAG: nicotinate-nucleotide adenylyltransferase [Bacteroidales bacterium]|nr:nicotinate-nucleotide adenylyltransferase [Bacteroidales bacterium]MBD5222657.1 nicotinate-nucleotide adenylyltransferase [Bacteroidales bacterium]MBD5302032.1 nicotinate-nucleotide adenylyltransferase [Bacteroides sp.]MBD5348295.1 nicotinate-nucleotide adenylyltransferase [Bacteroides sp.]